MANRSRIFIFGSVLTPVALYFGASMTMDHFDGQGWRFFNTGKGIAANLGSLAKAIKSKDGGGIESFYAPDFSGSPLGLTHPEQAEEKDGVRRSLFRSGGATQDGAAPTAARAARVAVKPRRAEPLFAASASVPKRRGAAHAGY